MKNKKNKKLNKAQTMAKEWQEKDAIQSDVLGSYTGTGDNSDLIPEQDADDL